MDCQVYNKTWEFLQITLIGFIGFKSSFHRSTNQSFYKLYLKNTLNLSQNRSM
ncbi:hypothetical protein LEP1GSC162_2118 [Leptospira santarosai str. CBC1531]|nr:hypothetical protein LEP1GSC162_2118 [Leptospira santarosai str. CBC1531]